MGNLSAAMENPQAVISTAKRTVKENRLLFMRKVSFENV
jgi:hypothetical protein